MLADPARPNEPVAPRPAPADPLSPLEKPPARPGSLLGNPATVTTPQGTQLPVRPSPAERRMLLAMRKRDAMLDCISDRVEWIHACTPAAVPPSRRMASTILHYADIAAAVLPGRIGRLLRTVTFFANIGRQIGLVRM